MGKGTLEKNGRSMRFFAQLDAQNNSTSNYSTTEEKADLSSVEDKLTLKAKIEESQNKRSLSTFVTPTSDLAPCEVLCDRDSNSDYSESVTEVTSASSHPSQPLEPSSKRDVSPVTAKGERSRSAEPSPRSQAFHQSNFEEENNSSKKEPIVPSTKQTISANTLDTKKIEKSKNEEDLSSLEHQQNINWLLQFLADLESTSVPHCRFASLEQLKNLFDELERRIANCYDELLKKCPDYLDRIMIAQKTVSDHFPLSSS